MAEAQKDRPAGTSLRLRVLGHVAVIGMLAVVAVAMFERVWVSGHPTSTVLCQCGDPGQAVWFMAWVPWAITHGHNPFFTTRMLAGQGGANLLQSTSYLLPAFLLAPVTWLFGATASFNVAETIAPILSGWCMYLATGRLSTRFVPRAVAALFYGCSPYLLDSEAFGHLNYDWLFFPPLLFLLCHEIVTGKHLRPSVAGLLLALAAVAQFFTGTEPLLISVTCGVVGLVVALAVAPRAAWRARRRIVTGFATALVAAGACLAYPLVFLLTGPRHVSGPPWPGINVFGIPPGATIHPGNVHVSNLFTRVGGYFGPQGPFGSFLGVSFLVVLAVGVLAAAVRRRRIVVPLVVAGLFAWLTALGVYLMPLASDSIEWWLPWKYLHNLPLFESAGPERFAIIVAAAAGLLLALGFDSIADLLTGLAGSPGSRTAPEDHQPEPAPAAPRRGVTVAADLVLLALALVAGVPIATTYSLPLTMNSGAVPQWFLTSATSLAPGTSVLTYPYASSTVPDAMYWQARDDLGFALVGGRALIPGADGTHSQHVSPLGGTDGMLTKDSAGTGTPSPPTTAQVRMLRASLRRWHVGDVVVVARGEAPNWAVAWFAEAIGRLPAFEEGAAVWDVQGGKGLGSMRLWSAATVARCDAQAPTPLGLRATAHCLSVAAPVNGRFA